MPESLAQPEWLKPDHVWRPYAPVVSAPPPHPIVKAHGTQLTLANGTTLIDGISSWWTACHGYNHPVISEAIRSQITRFSHIMFGGLAHAPAYELAERLATWLPGDLHHVFFAESGSVAVEIALKMALQHGQLRGERRQRFLAFRHAYHGDTFMAMAVSDPDLNMHGAYAGLVPPALFADLPRDDASSTALDELLDAHAPEIAAVIVEPLVQGAGGMRMHTAATFAKIRAACDRHGLILIADEIMTGFYRTGTRFATMAAGVAPDIICLGKALSGGTLPLAATIANERVFAPFAAHDAAFMHGPTFMANPLACAAANASLDLFEREPRQQQVAAIQRHLLRALKECVGLPGVRQVRVKGAIGVVEMDRPTAHLAAAFVQRGVWLRPFANIIYTMPPFTISPEELHLLTDAIINVVHKEGRHAPPEHSANPAMLTDVV